MKIFTSKQLASINAEKESALTLARGLETELSNLKEMSKDMVEKQAEHNNVIATLKADHETSITALKAGYENQIATLKTDSEKAIAELKAASEKTISDLQNQVKLEAASSEAKAITTLAKIGIPADELPKVSKGLTTQTPKQETSNVQSKFVQLI